MKKLTKHLKNKYIKNRYKMEKNQESGFLSFSRVNSFLEKIKGKDNYLTSSVLLAGIITSTFIILIAALLIAGKYSNKEKNFTEAIPFTGSKLVKKTPTPTPTPIPIISGPETYGISTKNNPQMRELHFNEFDPKIGDIQTITLRIKNTQNIKITTVEAELVTDNKTEKHHLKLISGSDIDGAWSASWKTNDSHLYKYRIRLTAKDEKNNIATANLGFR